jgi:hypothetical protein
LRVIGKQNIGRLYGVCLATVFTSLIAAGTHELWREHTITALPILVLLWIGFYFTGRWVAVDRPAELNKKIPVSSKELRRRTKAFYDWLASQGRRM